uniref:Calponin-homology (CH) domain-containing protein n=1 Tax=Panagrellus redivivus TaxID=6233 RepID=A0A7E5A0I7_PANRE
MWQFLSPLRAVSDEHEKIQKNTFTRWVNYHLETHSSSGQIRDLFEDIKDGVYLCHLIEVLTGEALPVNKARVSKRVHHVSNLTTALGVLRRRGLELINNNPTDLADGNPRIVLGLVWQMILHFQIETNLQLMHDMGWLAEQSMLPHTEVASTSASPSTSAPGTPKKPARFPQLHKSKQTVDRIMLEWIQKEIGQKYGINIPDMDKSWRDGIAFMALVHRSNPALVDMDVARRRMPRENLETAFELARVHLNIRPLLEVDDVLHEKPDKRSIITYVSQFLRAPTARYRTFTSEKLADRYVSLIEWIKATASDRRVVEYKTNKNNLPKDFFVDHEWFSQRRREFLERRVLFSQLRDESHQLEPTEWSNVLADWKVISELLRDWSHRLEEKLPEPLIDVMQWVASAELLVHAPIDVSRDKARHSIWLLDNMIENIEKHFKSMKLQRDKVQRAISDPRGVSSELLAPLQARLDALRDDYAIKHETLMLVRAHYRILLLIEELNKKMTIWKSAESFAVLQQWLADYDKEVEKNAPEARLHTLLAEMREAVPKAHTELRKEGEISYTDAESSVNETVKAFREIRHFLEELFKLWRQFETEATNLDIYLGKYEAESRVPIDIDLRAMLDRLETYGHRLGEQSSPVARDGISLRLSAYRRRVQEIYRRPIGGRLVVNIHSATSPSPAASPALPHSELDALSRIPLLKNTQLLTWMNGVSHLLHRRPKSAHGVARLTDKFNEYQRQIVGLEEERLRLYRQLQPSEKDLINSHYKRLRSLLPARIDTLRTVQPLLSDVERRLREIELFINNGEGSELRNLHGRERAEYLEQASLLLDTVEGQHSDVVNSGPLRLSLTSLRSAYEPSTYDYTDNLTVVDLPGTPVSARRVAGLRDRFEPVSPRLDRSRSPNVVDRVADLLERKEKILSRREDSASAAKASIREVEMVNEALTLHNATEHPQYEPLEAKWATKVEYLKRLCILSIDIDALNHRLREAVTPDDFRYVARTAEDYGRKLHDFGTFELPLLTECRRRVTIIRQNAHERKDATSKRAVDRLNQRLTELDMTPQEDIAIAEVVIKVLWLNITHRIRASVNRGKGQPHPIDTLAPEKASTTQSESIAVVEWTPEPPSDCSCLVLRVVVPQYVDWRPIARDKLLVVVVLGGVGAPN